MLKFKGCKNYDVKYLLNLFGSDYNYKSKVMKIINKDKMLIKKNTIGGIYTTKGEKMSNFTKKKKINTEKDLETQNNNLNLDTHKKKNILDITRDDNIKIKEEHKEGIELLNIHTIHNTSNNFNKKINTSRSFIESINSVNQQTNNIETNRIFYITPIRTETIIKKKNEEKYSELGIFSALWSKLFFWSSEKLKRRRDFFIKAEEKIHYFFDVYNYIQKMQEVDLLVYTLLDDDQVKLFDFLSRPPLQISPSKTNIYNEFESRQSLYMKIGKKPIDELYDSYNKIRLKKDVGFEDLKLLRLTNAEVKFLS